MIWGPSKAISDLREHALCWAGRERNSRRNESERAVTVMKSISGNRSQELIDDIRAAMTDVDLMEKYGLTSDQLSQGLERLYLKGLITGREMDERLGKLFSEDDMSDLAVDLKLGLFYDEIKEKYGLSEAELQKAFKGIASRGLASKYDVYSAVRAVNPREVVRDLLANESQERLKEKYDLSEDELSRLFVGLVDRSFISPVEFSTWHGVEPPVTAPPRVLVYEATDQFQISLVESLLDEADIRYLRRAKRRGTTWSPLGSDDPAQFFVEKAEADEARRRLYELQDVEARFIGEIRYEESDLVGLDPSDYEFVPAKNSGEDARDEETPYGPDSFVQLLGLAVLIVLLAHVFGLINF
jgi:uncharacterized protein (DUF433 family)